MVKRERTAAPHSAVVLRDTLESVSVSPWFSRLSPLRRSPTSSEDEMAQSLSDYSEDSASDREETVYETIGPAPSAPPYMEDVRTHSLVVRVLVPDLQQTVRGG
ncbi:unnamed protein product [Boreogadus saida]